MLFNETLAKQLVRMRKANARLLGMKSHMGAVGTRITTVCVSHVCVCRMCVCHMCVNYYTHYTSEHLHCSM